MENKKQFKLEQNLIGLLLKNTDDIDKINGIIKASDFIDKRHKKIFEYLELNSNIEFIDIVEKQKFISTEYYNEITTNFISYDILKIAILFNETTMRSQAKNIFKNANNDINNQIDVLHFLGNIENQLAKLTISKSSSDDFKKLSEFRDTRDIIDLFKKQEMNKILTGFEKLDMLLGGGVNRGQVIVIAARPGIGKTTLAINIMKNMLYANHKVGFFSLEMDFDEIMEKLILTSGIIKKFLIENPKQYKVQLEKIMRFFNKHEDNLFVDDGYNLSYNDLRRKSRKMKRQGVECIFIDYLGLMSPDKSESRNMEVTILSRQIQSLSKELKVPIFLLSQLNRAVELRNDKRPILADLRDSGSIEQDAYKVLLLNRPDHYNMDFFADKTLSKDKIEIIVAKNRGGNLGSVKLHFKGSTSAIKNI